MSRKLFSMLVLIAAVAVLWCTDLTTKTTTNTDNDVAVGRRGMVSSAHPLATEAGLDILKAGGNAFDAAVTVAAVLNVVEPMMSGIGGYGTIVIYDTEKDEARFLDSSGKIPLATDSDALRAPTPDYLDNRRGAMAVSTPGNVNAWGALSAEYGNLDWKRLFEAAIRLAEEGFPVSDRLARSIEWAFDDFSDYTRSFYGNDGAPLKSGERLIQKDLAASFRYIAERGVEAVYGGSIGQAIDKVMKESGGFLSITDLVADRAEWWEPIRIDYRGFEVVTASPPATAFPSLIRLGLMNRFDNRSLGHNSADYLHRFAEVTKHSFACRLAHAGDPEINPPPIDMLLSDAYLDEHVAAINLNEAEDFEYPDVVIGEDRHTTHFVVADRWGNIVSMTQTLGNLFGSRIMPEGTGIWLNNSLAYCTFEPKGNPMDAHAGHRKCSGDCPTLIFKDGRPWAAIGTPGGHTIGQTVPQMVMNLIDFDMDIQQAIAAPRVSFVEPNQFIVEAGIPRDVVRELKKRGHNVEQARLGNAHGLTIEYDEDGYTIRFTGGADPRGEGLAKGY